MSIHKRVLATILSIAVVLSIFSLDIVSASADAVNPMNFDYYGNGRADTISLDLDSGPVILSIDSGVNAFFQGSMADFGQDWSRFHLIDSGDTIRIYQSHPSDSTPNSILVLGSAYPFNVILDGVNIDTSNSGNPASDNTDANEQNHCAFCISATYESNVNLTLKGQNQLKSGPLFAGLQVEEMSSQDRSSLAISGDGSLTATGGTGASGIGGGACPSDVLSNTYMGCGDITVNGGKIIANGGAAGTVATDHLTAKVYGGAGIGGGGGGLTYNGGNAGNITIGGSAEVTAYGSGGGAGIGGGAGETGGSGGKISISGGTVTANGSTNFFPETLVGNPGGRLLRSAGIGGGGGYEIGGSGGTIHISSGIVTAISSGAAMVQRDGAPKTNSGFEYGGTVFQGSETHDIYYGRYYNSYCFRTDSALAIATNDGAGIGSGGNTQAEILTPPTDSESGGTINISGGTVTAESTAMTDTVLGGTGIGNSEAPFYDYCKHYSSSCSYDLSGSCVFTGGSINTNLTGSYAAAPAPTDKDPNGNPVYKTTAVLPEINTPVHVTPKDGSASPAQTDAQGGLSVWLPETNDTNTIAARVSVDGTERSYEMKGAVTTDGTSRLTILRTDAGLENLTFDGKEASPTSTSGIYQVNLASSATQVTVQKKLTSDLKSFTINGKPHSGTDTVALAISALETNLSIQIVGQDNSVKTYTVRVMRAGRNDAAMTNLSVDGMSKVPDADGAYRDTVPSSVTHVKVRAIPEDPSASYTVQANGKALTPDSDGADVTLVGAGSTTDISIVVSAEDGSTQIIYHLFLLRTAAPTPSSGSESSSNETSSAPAQPASVSEPSTGAQVDLSGAVLPAGVTNVTFAVTPETASGTPAGASGGTSDPQGASAFHFAVSDPALNLIGTPVLYNIKLLDQNGNPISSFTGSVTVKLPIPEGLHGAPHVFRYEESTGTFTDLGAAVQDGYLVFSTTHFSYYLVGGTGDSVTLDTRNYQIPVGGNYQIGIKLTGSKAAFMKVTSTNNKVVTAARLKNGNVQVTGRGTGTAYIMIDVYDRKNQLLTHASVRVDIKSGIRPRGDSTRQIGVF